MTSKEEVQGDGRFDSVENCIIIRRKGTLTGKFVKYNDSAFHRQQAKWNRLQGAFSCLEEGGRGRRLRLFEKHWKYIESKFNDVFKNINRSVFADIASFVTSIKATDSLFAHQIDVIPLAHLNVGVSFGDNKFWLDPLIATLRTEVGAKVVHVRGSLVQDTKSMFISICERLGLSSYNGRTNGEQPAGSKVKAKKTAPMFSRSGVDVQFQNNLKLAKQLSLLSATRGGPRTEQESEHHLKLALERSITEMYMSPTGGAAADERAQHKTDNFFLSDETQSNTVSSANSSPSHSPHGKTKNKRKRSSKYSRRYKLRHQVSTVSHVQQGDQRNQEQQKKKKN